MPTPRSPSLAAITAAGFMLAGTALAQCPPQRFFPDFQPTSLEFGMGVQISDEHSLVADRFGGAKIYTYQRDPASGRWDLSHTVPGGGAGASLALSGNRFITGSYDVERYGGAIVYDFDGVRWSETGRMESFDDPRWAYWGGCVTVHNSRGAMCNSNGGVLLFGENDEGDWEQIEIMRVPPSVTGRTDYGDAMDMDDRFFFIGAPGESVAGIQSGAVYIYEWDADGRPVLFQKLTPEPAPVAPRLGTSIDVDGDTMVVGARSIDIDGYDNVGGAFIYEFDGQRWVEAARLLPDPLVTNGQAGWDVAISGDLVAIGAITDRVGAAHVFHRNRSGQWRHVQRLTLDLLGFEYAESVALSATQLAIGGSEARHMGYDQGVADVYDLDCLLCPPDLDADGTLTVFDFLTFLNLFQDADPQADFDGDGELTIFDFLAFQTAFDAGC